MATAEPTPMTEVDAWAQSLDLDEARRMAYRYRRLYEASYAEAVKVTEWAMAHGIELPPFEGMGT